MGMLFLAHVGARPSTTEVRRAYATSLHQFEQPDGINTSEATGVAPSMSESLTVPAILSPPAPQSSSAVALGSTLPP